MGPLVTTLAIPSVGVDDRTQTTASDGTVR
jgi:hypothetical protein